MEYICEFVTMKGTYEIPLELAELLTDARSKDWARDRNIGALVPRKELDCRPVFKGFTTPMWNGISDDGKAILRYESWEVYDMLSR